jgi:hypothetical protein
MGKIIKIIELHGDFMGCSWGYTDITDQLGFISSPALTPQKPWSNRG